MPIYCACGCGTEIPQHRYPSQQSHYVKNHHRPRRGATLSESTKQKIAASKTKEDAGYSAIHVWMLKHHAKSGVCESCGKVGKTDWDNISGEYRRDRSDFRELCRSCHRLKHNRARRPYSKG